MNWFKRYYIIGDLTDEERINFESLERAIRSGVTIDYATFASQKLEFQEMWRDIYQAILSENNIMDANISGNEELAENILISMYSSSPGQALLEMFKNG